MKLNLIQPQDILTYKDEIALMIFETDQNQSPAYKSIKQKYIEDTLYTLCFLATSLEVNEPQVFINYMKWFGQLAFYLQFRLSSMKQHFRTSQLVFSQLASSDFGNQLLDTYLDGIEQFESSYQSAVVVTLNYDTFLKELLAMNSDVAYQYIMKQIDQGMTMKDVYLDILQPTLYQVGELWQQQVITVAKEYYITAAIQNIIGRLYPLLFQQRHHSKHSMTAVCAGSELHEIGMRMVADFFELSGWDTVFLGSNIPTEVVVKQLIESPTDILAISSTNALHLPDVMRLIELVKSTKELSFMKIMVGGHAFNEAPDLWKRLKADGFARDAEQAVLLATLLVGERNVA